MQTSIYFPLFTSVTSVGDAHATRARFLRRRPAGSSSEKNYSALVTVYLSVVGNEECWSLWKFRKHISFFNYRR